MKSERLLVALQGTEADAAPLDAALKLAAIFDADLRGVFVEPDPAAYMLWTGPGAAGASVVSTALDAVREEADVYAKAAMERFNTAVAASDLADAASFRRITDSPAEAAQQARLVRLLVTCPEAAAGKGPLADFTTACLVEEGCPLFVPRGGAIPARKIAVAWDGSKEAARAAFAAAPFFTKGVEVSILHSPKNLDYNDRAAAAPNRLANWLRPRGIEAKAVEIKPDGSLGTALLEASEGADLLVAGAYGQSRIAQFIFGGVTRTLLGAKDGPSLLIAH
ncbi:universal stress protein [Alkalicaulis satelles]|uniref:Universal stress protein n=1 Tax=Alkalicaulis satelles TaxID=2609175 RepID=A0A5M6Z8K2_9PROT|nr:universal stress protein [Alkalicaulis satelles]KAA5800972.1 universal stress protein [Alkalicaulis satelles]